jgi:hypothetical protein
MKMVSDLDLYRASNALIKQNGSDRKRCAVSYL